MGPLAIWAGLACVPGVLPACTAEGVAAAAQPAPAGSAGTVAIASTDQRDESDAARATSDDTSVDADVARPTIPTWRPAPHDPGDLPRWIRHEPRPLETIEQIAFRYDTKATSIRRANELADDEQPRKRRPKPIKVYAQRNPPPREPMVHIAKEGESWGSIARQYGVDTMDLRKQVWNATGAKIDPGEVLEFWIDPVVYGSIVDDRPVSDRLAEVRPGAHGRGSPQDGMLIAGVRIPDGEGYELRYPNSAWGTTFAVRATVEALDAYVARAKPPYPLRIGTMSRQRGREVGGHKSHQTGRDLDIRLPLRAEVPQSLPVLTRRVDWDLVWELVNAFDETGAVRVIFLDYRSQRRLYEAGQRHGASEETLNRLMQWPRGSASSEGLIRHEPGHADHIHVRFACGPAEPECVD